MECWVSWVDTQPETAAGMRFLSQTGSGHSLVMDGAAEGGGANLAPRPLELLLSGMAGCSAYDVALILKNSQQTVSELVVHVSAQRADSVPKVFTSIHLHYKVRGPQLSENIVNHAVRLSVQKYCSASIMLGEAVDISFSAEVI